MVVSGLFQELNNYQKSVLLTGDECPNSAKVLEKRLSSEKINATAAYGAFGLFHNPPSTIHQHIVHINNIVTRLKLRPLPYSNKERSYIAYQLNAFHHCGSVFLHLPLIHHELQIYLNLHQA